MSEPTQLVKLDKLLAPIACGPGRVEIETKRLRYVREEYEDRVWLVNGKHKLCLHVSWRPGRSAPIKIESITKIPRRTP